MNTCSTCTHWRKMPYKGISAAIVAHDVGECRGGTPVADFKWARTRGIDTCARWESATAAACTMGKAVAKQSEQRSLFDAGERAPAPGAGVLAYDATAVPSTAQGARPASDQPRNRKTRKENP